jgi:hypothetical protein
VTGSRHHEADRETVRQCNDQQPGVAVETFTSRQDNRCTAEKHQRERPNELHDKLACQFQTIVTASSHETQPLPTAQAALRLNFPRDAV